MTPNVEKAILEIQTAFSEHFTEVTGDSSGGAIVIVHNLPIGEQYTPSTGWIGFHLTFQYPHADVYPHYLDGAVRRVDGSGWGSGLSKTTWNSRSVIQISRRSKRLDASIDSATTKLAKVLAWLRSQ